MSVLMEPKEGRNRCPGKYQNDPIYCKYHDEEWGRPCHDDHALYELFVIELFQAGLSWATLLHKRENFRRAYDGFDIDRVAAYGEEKINELMQDAGIIRSRAKIEASIHNSRIVQEIMKEYGSFDEYLWSFSGGKSIYEEPGVTTNAISDAMAKDMKRRGMKFAGSVTIFSFLQAMGLINSHDKNCYCYREIVEAEAGTARQYGDTTRAESRKSDNS